MIVISTTYSLIIADAETGRFVLPLYPTDSAALSDTLLFVMSLPLADSVAASDVLVNDIVVGSFSDAGEGADALILSMTNDALDAMSAADVLGIFVRPGLSDVALGADAITVSSANVLTNTGTVTDALGTVFTIAPILDGMTAFDITGIRVNDETATTWYISKTETAAASDAGEIFIESYVEGHTYFAERYVGELVYF